MGVVPGGTAAGWFAFRVVGRRRLAKANRGLVGLLGHHEVAEQAGGLLDADDEDAGGHRVERARVADAAGVRQAADPRDDVVRGHAAGLVDDDESGLPRCC